MILFIHLSQELIAEELLLAFELLHKAKEIMSYSDVVWITKSSRLSIEHSGLHWVHCVFIDDLQISNGNITPVWRRRRNPQPLTLVAAATHGFSFQFPKPDNLFSVFFP